MSKNLLVNIGNSLVTCHCDVAKDFPLAKLRQTLHGRCQERSCSRLSTLIQRPRSFATSAAPRLTFGMDQIPHSKLTVSISSGSGIISEGSLEPAAIVTVMCDSTLTSQGASDMVVGVASAFREGFEMNANKIKFAFIEHKFSKWESVGERDREGQRQRSWRNVKVEAILFKSDVLHLHHTPVNCSVRFIPSLYLLLQADESLARRKLSVDAHNRIRLQLKSLPTTIMVTCTFAYSFAFFLGCCSPSLEEIQGLLAEPDWKDLLSGDVQLRSIRARHDHLRLPVLVDLDLDLLHGLVSDRFAQLLENAHVREQRSREHRQGQETA
eukprot:131414-Hanusia_phi.AAC.7